jgi:hypothetical protein
MMGDKENLLPALGNGHTSMSKESVDKHLQSLAEAAQNNHNVSAHWDDLFEFQLQELRRHHAGKSKNRSAKSMTPCAEAEALTSDLSILTQAQANNTHGKLNAWLALAAFTR